MTLTYTLDGFDLHQPNLGFRLLAESTFAGEVAPRRVNITIPQMHGEIPAWNDPLSTLLLTLNVEIKGTDAASLEQRWNHLRALCRLGGNLPVTVQRVASDRTTSTFAQLQSMTEPDFYCPTHTAITTMLFHIPRGRWQDVNASEQQLAIPGTDQNVVFAAESTGPVTNALVRASGPIGSLEVSDNTNETGFLWAPLTPIASDEYLLVDCEMFTAWRNTDDNWESRGNDESRWLRTLGNGMLTLVPSPSFTIGANTNSITVSATGTDGTTELHIRGRRTYA